MRCRRVLLLFVLFVGGCATPEVGGLYASRISKDDVAQISALVESRPDIRKAVYRIWADGVDRAIVRSGAEHYIDAEYSEFTVVKVRGKWKIVSRIEHGHIYGTG